MQRYFRLGPEVAGGLGRKTVVEGDGYPPNVTRLHYEFYGWLGDDLLRAFPCYVVTERLRAAIEESSPTGCSFDQVLVTTTTEFRALFPDVQLPRFSWLRVVGQPGVDDFGMGEDPPRLIVSEQVLEVLKRFSIANCEVEEV